MGQARNNPQANALSMFVELEVSARRRFYLGV
jgi:hypothetical protein